MSTNNTYVLAIDNGTQSIRAVIVDQSGNLVAVGRESLDPYFSRQPGWAEQDPEYYWSSLKKACARLWQESPVPPEQIQAVTLTTQRGTVICVDEQGRALRPAILWLDQREAEVRGGLGLMWETLFRLARVKDTIARFRRKTQANWIAQNEPEIWKKTHKFLLLSGYLSQRLTGEFRDSVAAQVGYLPFDYRRQRWAAEHDWKWQAMPLQRQQLPELVAPGAPLGQLTHEAAEWIGLPAGIPVLAAASDKACEVLGSGGYRPDTACLSYGTTATINTGNDRYVEAIPFMPPYPSAIAGLYNSEVMIYRGFWMVSWFRKEFGLREERLAAEQGVAPETLFDELLRKVPPGSMGLTLQPYWSPGVREPGPEAKGSIIGFGDVHTRAHIYRAILEGLAYALREGKERLEKRNRQAIQTLRVSGGGSQSDEVLQLTANVFNLPVERPHTYETSALGAAMDAMLGLGVYKTPEAAIAGMTRVGARFEPDPETAAVYEKLYREVYQRMYPSLKPLYEKIRQITGYPAA